MTSQGITKLLPGISHYSNRAEARTLLIAYLTEKTPDDYLGDIQILAKDPATGNVECDFNAETAARWDSRSRGDASFAEMWLSMDSYMHDPAPAAAVEGRILPFVASQQQHAAESSIGTTEVSLKTDDEDYALIQAAANKGKAPKAAGADKGKAAGKPRP